MANFITIYDGTQLNVDNLSQMFISAEVGGGGFRVIGVDISEKGQMITMAKYATKIEAQNYIDSIVLLQVDKNSGHITIFPSAYNSIGQGTWEWVVVTGNIGNGMFYNTSNTDADNLLYKVYLAKGTYSLKLLAYTYSNRGIMDIYIDADKVATFDQYSAGAVNNVNFSQTGIVVATAGLKTLTFKVNGQNVGSTGYYITAQMLSLWRTA